ncbi:hypothetical protein [Aeromicrobium sp. CTD01-1L150]|uniref:hypothetical protein n=1 Tax=Aeromicrobium sp. CTD01-1L150 TaxID=3341830 RepID=UPI0035C046B3
MISRRVVLGGSAVLALAGTAGAAHVLGVDDDVLRALGARPKALPDDGDTALLATAAEQQADIVAGLDAVQADSEELVDLRAIAAEQLEGLGGSDLPASPSAQGLDDLASLVAETGKKRQDDVTRAVSPALVTVLASLSAGHAQLARRLRSLA